MWTTRLLVLGLVRWLQPVHGYDVQRELLSWDVEQWANVKPGSIYHALKKLAADDCLSVVSHQQVDNRPARTTYEMTPKGEEEFQSLLRQKLWEVDHPLDSFWVAWSFLTVLSIRESSAMLRNRANQLRDSRDQFRAAVANHGNDPREENFVPKHVVLMMDLQSRLLETSAQWCEETAGRIEAGEVYSVQEHQISENAQEWKANIQRLGPDGKLRD